MPKHKIMSCSDLCLLTSSAGNRNIQIISHWFKAAVIHLAWGGKQLRLNHGRPLDLSGWNPLCRKLVADSFHQLLCSHSGLFAVSPLLHRSEASHPPVRIHREKVESMLLSSPTQPPPHLCWHINSLCVMKRRRVCRIAALTPCSLSKAFDALWRLKMPQQSCRFKAEARSCPCAWQIGHRRVLWQRVAVYQSLCSTRVMKSSAVNPSC